MILNCGLKMPLLFLVLFAICFNVNLALSVPGVVVGQGGFGGTVCETNPTPLVCNTTAAVGHALISNLPAGVILRPCSVFLVSPHCCAQFCLPGAGGTCDSATGACFCNPSGVPDACQVRNDNTPASQMGANDQQALDLCRQNCASNPNGCTKPATATDGIVGTVCMCYC